ncbi:MAG: hypothetical protein HN657_06050, partial [Candidatus Marinimicrobia bacterium]|nr:hypothetical protein [Candidatus Neomarinimicrobiota bacterium]MBT3497012.1 hypothetical protein [Candidatus Neomarinimicrobiota bacterium]MBT3692599.1 hypothetical protein [Candidatus Neomarinimicrobiota bacterium]MBT3732431.1 hypothetical protein [Candidatus Neomarinimicrobiota bacterium]MBT4176860.1 hypothetical protein [Candidatus Neomarinimicrobiota bacterium]
MNKIRIILFLLLSMTTLAFGQDSTRFFSPKKAAYSALIPGGGQIYNRKYIKAGLVVGLEIWAYTSYLRNAKYYNQYEEYSGLEFSQSRYLKKRNKYVWWTGFIWLYSMIDAVVDAHLHPFEDVMKTPIENE